MSMSLIARLESSSVAYEAVSRADSSQIASHITC
jgi:hypothetical protein